MRVPAGSLVKNMTLNLVREIVNETNVRYCVDKTKNGVEVLSVVLENADYLIGLDGEVLTFMFHAKAPVAGDFGLVSNWNMFEAVGTAICLDNGYLMKFGVLVSGGVVRETLRDAVVDFNNQTLKFSNKVQQAHK